MDPSKDEALCKAVVRDESVPLNRHHLWTVASQLDSWPDHAIFSADGAETLLRGVHFGPAYAPAPKAQIAECGSLGSYRGIQFWTDIYRYDTMRHLSGDEFPWEFVIVSAEKEAGNEYALGDLEMSYDADRDVVEIEYKMQMRVPQVATCRKI